MQTNVYLRHAKTHSYYSGWHSWTEDVDRAVNFESSEIALKRARDEQMHQVEVVIRGEDLARDTVLPVV